MSPASARPVEAGDIAGMFERHARPLHRYCASRAGPSVAGWPLVPARRGGWCRCSCGPRRSWTRWGRPASRSAAPVGRDGGRHSRFRLPSGLAYAAGVGELEIRQVAYDDPVAQTLVAAAMADLGQRYGGPGDETPVHPAEFTPPQGMFLVAYLDGAPVGCGGWRSSGDSGTVAELKRMFTVPAARRRGVARRVLAAVEESARAAGRSRMILECGDRQPEAIELY